MDERLISVIIPVYNAEEYLRLTLETLVGQEDAAWEALCIDDGSRDGSADILCGMIRKDARIHGIFKRNGGVSSARNVGLRYVSGDYVFFLDSDDGLTLGCLSRLRQALESGHADMAICGTIDRRFYAGSEPGVGAQSVSLYTKDEFYNNRHRFGSGVVWGKLIRRSLITERQLTFDERMLVAEDTLFFLLLMLNAERIAVMDGSDGYLYRPALGRASLMTRARDAYLQCSCKLVQSLVMIGKTDELAHRFASLEVETLCKRLTSFEWPYRAVKAALMAVQPLHDWHPETRKQRLCMVASTKNIPWPIWAVLCLLVNAKGIAWRRIVFPVRQRIKLMRGTCRSRHTSRCCIVRRLACDTSVKRGRLSPIPRKRRDDD